MSDSICAKFDPGDSQVNVSIPIMKDQIFEPTEFLMLNLTVPDKFSNINGRLCITPGNNNFVKGEIIDSNGMFAV